MKKILGCLVTFLFLFGMIPSADTMPTVEFSAPDSLKKGEKATISINIKDVDRLYGVQMDYTFNTNEIKVLSATKGKMLSDVSYGSMDSSGNEIVEGKPVKFYLTFMGENDGVSGDGEIVNVEVEALKDCKLSFDSSNMEIILVQISEDYEIGKIPFKLIGTEKEEVIDPSEPSSGGTSNGGSSSNTGSNNTGNSNTSSDSNTNNSDSNTTSSNDGSTNSNKKVTSNGDKNVNTSDNSESSTESSNNIYIYVLLAVIVLGGIGGYIFWKKKQEN